VVSRPPGLFLARLGPDHFRETTRSIPSLYVDLP
jgi:hypothetical protein